MALSIKSHPRGHARREGFSLIEIVIALAVTSVAVLTIVGMLSGAMINYNGANQKSVINQIHDQIAHDLQQLTWDATKTPVTIPVTATPIYFDAEGNLLPDSTGAIYEAILGTPNYSVTVPGTTYVFNDNTASPGNGNPSMAAITTSIYRLSGGTQGPLINTYTDYVCRN